MDMLLSAVSVLVVAQSISEIPEGLMNKPVYFSTYLTPASQDCKTQLELLKLLKMFKAISKNYMYVDGCCSTLKQICVTV